MAEKCPYCDWRVQKSEEFALCPVCGAKHHASCWNYATKCYKCGNIIKDGCQEGQIENIEKESTSQTTELTKEYINIAKENINNILNDEETGLFANVDEKLKSWAKASYGLGIICGIITAVAIIAIDGDFIIPGILSGVMEIAAAWAFSLILYAFGEVVSNSKESKKLQQQILDELKNKKE